MFARLVRTYGIDPDRLLELPGYQLAYLAQELPALEAEELQREAAVSMLPHQKAGDRRRALRRWHQQARLPEPPRKPVEIIEENPTKAAAWFRAHGIEVIDGDGTKEDG